MFSFAVVINSMPNVLEPGSKKVWFAPVADIKVSKMSEFSVKCVVGDTILAQEL